MAEPRQRRRSALGLGLWESSVGGMLGPPPAMGTQHGAGARWFGPGPGEDEAGAGGVLESGGDLYTCRCVFT